MFEFKIALNDDDYLLFNQYHLLNSPMGKRNLKYFRLIIPFFCFLVVVIFSLAESDFLLVLNEAIAMTILSILWIVFSKKIILKSMKKNIIKMRKDGKLPYSNEEAILRFDDESVHEITPSTENKMKYSMIEKIAVTEKAIYIYFNSMQACILPVIAFSDEEKKQKFLRFINMKAEISRETK